MKVGVNCHPTHWETGELAELIKALQDLGCSGVRFPLWRGNESHYRAFVDLCLPAGIEVLPVLDRRAFLAEHVEGVVKNYPAGMLY